MISQQIFNPTNQQQCSNHQKINLNYQLIIQITNYNCNMSYFVKKAKRIYHDLMFKVSSVYRGQSYSSFEASFIFNSKNKGKERNRISLKYQNYPELNKYFIQFLNSAQSNGRVNGDNLAFLIGTEGVGKTTYAETNIEKFKHLKHASIDKNNKQELPQIHKYKTPQYIENQTKQQIFDNQHYLIFNFNFARNRSFNFSGFLNNIHEQIISQIVRLNNKLNGTLLDSQLIKDVLIADNSAEYLYIYLKDVVYCILNDTDIIMLSENGKKELEDLNIRFNGQRMEATQFFAKGMYKQVINTISKDLSKGQTETALRLFLSIGKRIQYQNRPPTHINSWYQTGVQSTDILFDILNFLCGFGKLNKQLFQDYFQLDDSKEYDSSQKIVNQSELINSIRVDVGMVFLNMQQLYIYDSPEYWKFIDHLISRTANSSGLRTHFPLMLQFPNYSDFQDMHNMGQFNLGSPVVIQLPGYLLYQFKLSTADVSDLFTPKILTRLFFALGRNPKTWNKALIQLAKGQTTIEQIIHSKAKYIKKQQIRVEAKANLLFTHPQILPQLADNTAKYQLIQFLRLINKTRGLIMIPRPGYYIDIYSRPIWKLLLKENLLYQHYYLPYINLGNQTDLSRLVQFKNQLLRGRVLNFLRWRFNNIGRFTFYTRQIKFRENWEKNQHDFNQFFKKRTQAQIAQSYYGANQNYIFHYREKGVMVEIY